MCSLSLSFSLSLSLSHSFSNIEKGRGLRQREVITWQKVELTQMKEMHEITYNNCCLNVLRMHLPPLKHLEHSAWDFDY